ncbi:hypothetical protein [Devosia sp.]|uniref:hypothetical protein n=1 Tax=Devosia sp. TaxID=1871048 RepID=UPI001ACF8166|nr:hypothetical protein [Devosia sp.]MBN9332279.1 hypothetical protein [Devosia sp.]
MPKNPFQRPQPINHSHNVPRHGQQQHLPQKLQTKPKQQGAKSGLPPLEKLLSGDRQH